MIYYEVLADTKNFKAGDLILVEEYQPAKDLIGKLALVEEDGKTQIIRIRTLYDLTGRHLVGVITYRYPKPEPLL